MREKFPSEERAEEKMAPGTFGQILEQDMARIEMQFEDVHRRGPFAAWELLDRLTQICVGKRDEVA